MIDCPTDPRARTGEWCIFAKFDRIHSVVGEGILPVAVIERCHHQEAILHLQRKDTSISGVGPDTIPGRVRTRQTST